MKNLGIKPINENKRFWIRWATLFLEKDLARTSSNFKLSLNRICKSCELNNLQQADSFFVFH